MSCPMSKTEKRFKDFTIIVLVISVTDTVTATCVYAIVVQEVCVTKSNAALK